MEERTRQLIRIWIPLILVAVIITVLVASLLGVPLNKSLTAAGLTVGLVLSGFFFRSHGRGKWDGRGQHSGTKLDR